MQINYSGDNSNQLIGLDSIGDSNSSSSFDMERRSFSSNSNQSTLGNYVTEHNVFSASSQQNGSHGLPSALSSLSYVSSGSGSASNFTYPDISKKSSNIIPFTPSPDDRANNLSQISDTNNSNSNSASIMQPNVNLSNTSLNTSTGLPNLGDYSVQMNQLNDLINDDNGDGLDMSFWENFDNFSYESDLLSTNNNGLPQTQQQSHHHSHHHHQQQQLQQQQIQSISKSSSKRSNSSHEGSDRKRKRVNEPKDISNYGKKDPSKDIENVSKLANEISFSSNIGNDIGNNSILEINTNNVTNKKLAFDPARAENLYSNLSSHGYNNNAQASIKSFTNSSINDVICIDDDDDDDTNNNVDATVNRNANKDNGLMQTPTTPTKELAHSSDEMSTKHLNGIAASPLAVMTLSNDPIVNSTDLINVTKILSEGDHHLSTSAAVVTTPSAHQQQQQQQPTQQPNESAKSQANQNHLSSVPIDENENFLLDMVYKCLRGKGVRMINSNYASSSSHNTNRSSSNDSSRSREKENSIDNHLSDDEMSTANVTVNSSNSLLLPAAQRYSSSRSAYVPRPIETNRFNMARGHGVCHIKHSVDSTKKIQQQIFHRLQTQQHNGTTFANVGASMIALRNNGSIMRLNSANLIGSSLSSITNAINNSANGPNTIKTNSSTSSSNASSNSNSNSSSTTNAAPVSTSTTTTNTQSGKIAAKKSVHIVNSIANSGNGPTGIVFLNSSGTGTTSSTSGNQTYAIFRRPPNQSIQLIAARSPIDPNNSYSLMPVIHRVRTRTLKPTLPQTLQSDHLIQQLKTIRPKKLKRTLSTTKKIISVYNSYMNQSVQSNHHITPYNSNSIGASNGLTSNGSSRSQKTHSSSLSNHKSNHTSAQSTTTSSTTQKQNGHIRSYAC